MGLTLYSVSDGPPSVACRMALKELNLDYKLVEVDYANGQFLTEQYAKLNPQKEIPVLDDDGFILSESVAIVQYLADKYGKNDSFYPKDPQRRAIVNHRMVFNIATYYRDVGAHVMAPIFFDYERTEMGKKKVDIALSAFNEILKRQNTDYAAVSNLTIADLPLVCTTMCLEAIQFSLQPYSAVAKWYSSFKRNHPHLWDIAKSAMQEITDYDANVPKLPNLNHPIHPVRK